MRRIGIYIDLSNLYYTCLAKYNRKIDYQMFRRYCEDLGTIVIAKAYGSQLGKKSSTFIKHLELNGFTAEYRGPKIYKNGDSIRRKADWDVGITVEIIKNMAAVDVVILGSADGDFTPLVKYLRENNKTVIVIACKLSRELKTAANIGVEIPESFLEVRNV